MCAPRFEQNERGKSYRAIPPHRPPPHKPPEQQSQSGMEKRNMGTEREEPQSRRIFVARIPSTITQSAFREYFKGFGEVEDAYMPKDPKRKHYRGIGFVTYVDPASTELVLSIKHRLDGHEVVIDRASPKDTRACRSSHSSVRRHRSTRSLPGDLFSRASATPPSKPRSESGVSDVSIVRLDGSVIPSAVDNGLNAGFNAVRSISDASTAMGEPAPTYSISDASSGLGDGVEYHWLPQSLFEDGNSAGDVVYHTQHQQSNAFDLAVGLLSNGLSLNDATFLNALMQPYGVPMGQRGMLRNMHG